MMRLKILYARMWANIRGSVGGGLLIIMPVAVTYAVGSFAFKFSDNKIKQNKIDI